MARTAARATPAELAESLGMRLGSELRAGALPVVTGIPPRRPVYPVLQALQPLLPSGGLAGQIGVDVNHRGATSLLCSLVAAATTAGLWCAVLDRPRLYPLAAVAAGVRLDRLALVDVPDIESRLDALGILCEGIPVVIASTRGFTPRQLQRASARAARSGTAVIWLEQQPVPRLDARIAVTACTWTGLRPNLGRLWGAGRLGTCRLRVTSTWRGGQRAIAELWPYGRGSSMESDTRF
ncbi:hypothetical protein [Glycomyces sp. NPDC048151]|uniref:hypothetical protein n=1 Tax=Glycomyces sp. NPDC048151 TaxID=3364002 RepID=UPI00371F63D9